MHVTSLINRYNIIQITDIDIDTDIQTLYSYIRSILSSIYNTFWYIIFIYMCVCRLILASEVLQDKTEMVNHIALRAEGSRVI